MPVIATLIEMGGRVVFQNELSRNYWGDFEVNPNNRTSAASNISSGANGKSMCPCVSVCVCVRVCVCVCVRVCYWTALFFLFCSVLSKLHCFGSPCCMNCSM